MNPPEPKSLQTCTARASELLEFLHAFYREELAEAHAGELEKLKKLQEKRDRSEHAIGELKTLFGFLRTHVPAAHTAGSVSEKVTEEIQELEARLSAVAALAGKSSDQSSRVREGLLEGFRVLHAMQKAYIADKRGGNAKGVLIDKEG